MERGSIDELHIGPMRTQLQEGWVSIHNLHFGNYSPAKQEKGSSWCIIFDSVTVPKELEYVRQRPVFASTRVRNTFDLVGVFRRLRRLCVSERYSPDGYDPDVAMFDAVSATSHEGSGWRLKGLLLDLLSQLLDCGGVSSADGDYISEPVARALELIEDNFCDANISLSQIAHEVRLSKVHFGRLFASKIGYPPMCYIQNLRLREAAILLRQTEQRIEQIAYAVGYGDPLYFTRLFRRRYGMSPRAFRKLVGGIGLSCSSSI